MSSNYMQEANALADKLRGKTARAAAKSRPGRAPANEPTRLQTLILAHMRRFFLENDQLPPVSEVSKTMGLAHGSAHHHIIKLTALGFLEPNAVGKLRFARTENRGTP